MSERVRSITVVVTVETSYRTITRTIKPDGDMTPDEIAEQVRAEIEEINEVCS